ncbi:MAG: hypothetical protein ACXWSC_19380, partial [Bdellovibrionota bacterium]
MKALIFPATAVFAVLFSSPAFAGETLDRLLAETQKGSSFVQSTSETHCPDLIQLKISDNKPEWAQPGDGRIYLEGNPLSKEGHDHFTFEGNSFVYRPKLEEGSSHVLKRSLEFPAGVAYSVTEQKEANGVFISEYHAKIAATSMIATSHFRLSFNAGADQIVYDFEGNGVSPVHCEFHRR